MNESVISLRRKVGGYWLFRRVKPYSSIQQAQRRLEESNTGNLARVGQTAVQAVRRVICTVRAKESHGWRADNQ